jgi:hypothetical protein
VRSVSRGASSKSKHYNQFPDTRVAVLFWAGRFSFWTPNVKLPSPAIRALLNL